MKTNAIKHYSEILSDARVQKQLLKNAPRSCISGKPLTLTLTRADKSDSRSFRLVFENSLDPDGWIGQQDGIHAESGAEHFREDNHLRFFFDAQYFFAQQPEIPGFVFPEKISLH